MFNVANVLIIQNTMLGKHRMGKKTTETRADQWTSLLCIIIIIIKKLPAYSEYLIVVVEHNAHHHCL